MAIFAFETATASLLIKFAVGIICMHNISPRRVLAIRFLGKLRHHHGQRNVRLEIDEIGVIAGIATDSKPIPRCANAISCFPPYRTYTVTRFNAPWPV